IENKHPDTPLILETLARAHMYHLRYGPAIFFLDLWIQEEPEKSKPYQWRAWVLERVRSYDGAMRDYNRSLELDPHSYEVRLRLAEIYMDRSNPPAAIPHLEMLMKEFPDRPHVLARLGQCRFQQGEEKEARRLLYKASETLDNDPALFLTLGKLELEDNPVEAETWLRRLLKIDPFDPEGQFALFTSLQKQGRT